EIASWENEYTHLFLSTSGSASGSGNNEEVMRKSQDHKKCLTIQH
ncbi:20033_t:CDS:2, partial [Racocetra persica]